MAHLTKETAAEAVSFVATDINKIFEGMQEIHYLWGAPIEAGAILALLASLVGIYCLPGVGVLCLVVPAQVGLRCCAPFLPAFPACFGWWRACWLPGCLAGWLAGLAV
jgi:hypothetical protein